MRIALDEQALAWRAGAEKFAREELIPREVEAEFNGGSLPPEVLGSALLRLRIAVVSATFAPAFGAIVALALQRLGRLRGRLAALVTGKRRLGSR